MIAEEELMLKKLQQEHNDKTMLERTLLNNVYQAKDALTANQKSVKVLEEKNESKRDVIKILYNSVEKKLHARSRNQQWKISQSLICLHHLPLTRKWQRRVKLRRIVT